MLRLDLKELTFAKALWLSLGFLGLGFGVIDVFVPGMPSTVFLLIALWGFSRGSQRFHDWLYNHPRLGPPLQAWREHRAIPLGAKLAALFGMSLGYVGLAFTMDPTGPVCLAYLVINALAAIYIVSRPSSAPVREAVPAANDNSLMRPASLGLAALRALPYR